MDELYQLIIFLLITFFLFGIIILLVKNIFSNKYKIIEYNKNYDKYGDFYNKWFDYIEKEIATKKLNKEEQKTAFRQTFKHFYYSIFPNDKEETTQWVSNLKINSNHKSEEEILVEHAIFFYTSLDSKRKNKKNFTAIISEKYTTDEEEQFGTREDHPLLIAEIKKLNAFATNKDCGAKFAILRTNWCINDDKYIDNGIKWLISKEEYKKYGISFNERCPIIIFVHDKKLDELLQILYYINILSTEFTDYSSLDVKNHEIIKLFSCIDWFQGQIKNIYECCSSYFEQIQETHKEVISLLGPSNKELLIKEDRFKELQDTFAKTYEEIKTATSKFEYLIKKEEPKKISWEKNEKVEEEKKPNSFVSKFKYLIGKEDSQKTTEIEAEVVELNNDMEEETNNDYKVDEEEGDE